MMDPNPMQRPDVNTLLNHPKIIEVQESRRKGYLRKRFVSIIWEAGR